MKVFGGNGRRKTNTNRKSQADRAGEAERNYINNADRGYNNAETPPKRQKPDRKPPKKKKAGKTVLIVLLIIAAIVAGVYIWWKATAKPPEVISDDPATAAPEETQQVPDNRYYTLMVVGIDQENINTDTIMVVRYDAVENKANVVSIPRDTLINTENPVKKINDAYNYAKNNGDEGISGLMDAVEGVCGFRPNNYICIDTSVFVQAINLLGGVYFDVPIDMNYEDYSDWDEDGVAEYVFKIHVQKGYQLLNGENALGVFRYRSGYTNGDWDRIEVQHNFIKAVADQALQLKNLTKLVEIAKLVSDNSDTDLTLSNLQWYAQEFMKMSMDDISISTMPTSGAWINGFAYVTINVDDWISILNEQLNPFDREITAEDCMIMRQKYTEPDKNSYNADNYYTTDGSDAYTNFAKNIYS